MASDRAKRTMQTFLNQGEAESLTYRPAGGGASRIVQALVDRPGRDAIGGVASPHLEITLLNDAALGALPPGAAGGLNAGGDTIDVAEWPGGAAVRRQIVRVEAADADFVTVEVR